MLGQHPKSWIHGSAARVACHVSVGTYPQSHPGTTSVHAHAELPHGIHRRLCSLRVLPVSLPVWHPVEITNPWILDMSPRCHDPGVLVWRPLRSLRLGVPDLVLCSSTGPLVVSLLFYLLLRLPCTTSTAARDMNMCFVYHAPRSMTMTQTMSISWCGSIPRDHDPWVVLIHGCPPSVSLFFFCISISVSMLRRASTWYSP